MADPFFSPYDVIDDRDAEIARLKKALVEAEQRADDVARDKPIEDHGIDSCPTWHDRCHCNMETLRLYMEAMRGAESERDEARRERDYHRDQNKRACDLAQPLTLETQSSAEAVFDLVRQVREAREQRDVSERLLAAERAVIAEIAGFVHCSSYGDEVVQAARSEVRSKTIKPPD